METNHLETNAYNLKDFIRCCKNKHEDIQVEYDALLNAREQFRLNTKTDLLAFIGSKGLQDLIYVSTELWRNNPKKEREILIDSYKFRSNSKLGYIAFMKGFSGNYVIKSFHLDHDKLTLKGAANNSDKLAR